MTTPTSSVIKVENAVLEAANTLRLQMLAYCIGASSAQVLDELVKTAARKDLNIASSSEVPYGSYYRVMVSNFFDPAKTPGQENYPILDGGISGNATAKLITRIVTALLNENRQSMQQVQKVAREIEASSIRDKYTSAAHDMSFLLLMGCLNGIRSAAVDEISADFFDTTHNTYVDLMQLSSNNDKATLTACMTCAAIVTRSILKAADTEQLNNFIGEAVYYMIDVMSRRGAKDAASAVTNYFESRWRLVRAGNGAQVQFTKFAGASNPTGFISTLLPAELSSTTVMVLFDLLYSIERLLYSCDKSYYYAITVTSFVKANTAYSSSLVGGWYGLKFGIMDQNVKQGIPPFAISPVPYMMTALVDACGDLISL